MEEIKKEYHHHFIKYLIYIEVISFLLTFIYYIFIYTIIKTSTLCSAFFLLRISDS